MKRFLAVLFSLMVLSCATTPEPDPYEGQYPPNAYEFTPLEIYHDWYLEVETCLYDELQLPRPRINAFEDVRWFLVPGDAWQTHYGAWVDGAHFPLTRRIYLVETKHGWKSLVKHELMHYLSTPIPTGHHPKPPFWHCEFY